MIVTKQLYGMLMKKLKKRNKKMLHKMKLNKEPFDEMKNETKTIEFRLYDEKR